MLVRYTHNKSGKQVKQALVYTGQEHGINPAHIENEARRIVQGLQRQGYEAYIVGGAVRDLLIGKVPKDFDIATSAEPARIRKIFKNSRIIGKRFRLVHVVYGQKRYEVSTFRSLQEGTVGNMFGTISEDVMRRDFTLNALYYDPRKNLIIDYVGGVDDIRKRKIRPIIPLPIIFTEDPVRMIRALKYAVFSHGSLPFLLRCRLHIDAPLLEDVSPSRLTEEINKIFMSGHSYEIVKSLFRFNLFLYMQPSAYAFMEDTDGFFEKYMDGLHELDTLVEQHTVQRQGHYLVYLIRDFLNLITDWDGIPHSVYKTVYTECRHFVLPMNPQRTELEYAVKYCLKQGGLTIRMPRTVKKDSENETRYPIRTSTRQGNAAKVSSRRYTKTKSN